MSDSTKGGEKVINLGPVTAYGFARKKGYTGTEEEFSNEIISLLSMASDIETDITTFIHETLPDAIQAIRNEGDAQILAIQAKGEEIRRELENLIG